MKNTDESVNKVLSSVHVHWQFGDWLIKFWLRFSRFPLKESMAAAMEQYPDSCAVLVRRHGVYVWGQTWQKAKAMWVHYSNDVHSSWFRSISDRLSHNASLEGLYRFRRMASSPPWTHPKLSISSLSFTFNGLKNEKKTCFVSSDAQYRLFFSVWER